MTDCAVTMTRSGYAPRQSRMHGTFDKSMSSTGADFRGLTPLVLMDALRRAGTRVHEPIHALRLEIPADTLAAVLPRAGPAAGGAAGHLAAGRGVGDRRGDPGGAGARPAAAAAGADPRRGGRWRAPFARYEPVRGPAPSRPRTDHNPLDRKEYLLRVLRRAGAAAAG